MHHHQRTLSENVEISGVGLHTGEPSVLTIRPLPADSGINFRRVDLPGKPIMKASWENVQDTSLATSLGCNGYRVGTVEHLMAAFHGLAIDNALVDLDSTEVPILDGSSKPFVSAIKEAGIRVQDAPRQFLVVEEPIELTSGDRSIKLSPFPSMEIDYSISFDHPLLADQTLKVNMSEEMFVNDISPARTFGFLSDVVYLRKNGFALGGSLENAVVLDDQRVLNHEGLRFEDEFVRHKILDLLGDLYLIGLPILGKFKVKRAGHALVHQFIKKLTTRMKSYRIEGSSVRPLRKDAGAQIPQIGVINPVPA